MPDTPAIGRASELLAGLDRRERNGRTDSAYGPRLESLAEAWLQRAGDVAPNADDAIEALAWSHALPRLTRTLTPERWQTLLERLLEVNSEAAQLGMDADPLVHQLLAGELGLTLAYLFPDSVPCRKRLPAARRALSLGLAKLLDGEGLPHARHLDLMRPLLACWTRCVAIGRQLPQGCWTAKAQRQYEWLVRQSLRFVRHDGSQAFSQGPNGHADTPVFHAALRLGGDDEDRRIAALALPGKKKAGRTAGDELSLPGMHSEWAATAVLRTGWSAADPWLAVLYPGTEVRTELHSGRSVLWSGPWQCEVFCDGQKLEPQSSWEEICWFSDEDADYVELEIHLTGGVRVQRHILLAREDRFLFLADAILGTAPAKLEYHGCLPLAPGVSFHGAEEAREGFLRRQGERQRDVSLVVPLALPEWRCDPPGGTLSQSERGLELQQSAQGSALFAPLFFDLQPRRMARPMTWRQLTVAENLTIQPADMAVGYRVMIDNHQWLIYRSLGPKGNRTLLGHNLATEMLVARFLRSGEVEKLLEIE